MDTMVEELFGPQYDDVDDQPPPQQQRNAPPPPQPQQSRHPQSPEPEMRMPVAIVVRIMRKILPSNAKISDEAKEVMQECVSEFIHFITGEASSRSETERRKTLIAEDLIWALDKTGFDDYLHPLTRFLQRYRESMGISPANSHMPRARRSLLPPAPRPPLFGPHIGPFNPSLGPLPPLPPPPPFAPATWPHGPIGLPGYIPPPPSPQHQPPPPLGPFGLGLDNNFGPVQFPFDINPFDNIPDSSAPPDPSQDYLDQ